MLFKLPIAASLASAALLLSSSVAASNATFSLVGYGEGIDRTEIYFDYFEAYLGNGTRSVELVFNASFTTANKNLSYTFMDPLQVVLPAVTDLKVGFAGVPTDVATVGDGIIYFVTPAEQSSWGVSFTGFGYSGKQLVYQLPTGEIGSFWAQPAGESADVWKLGVGVNGTLPSTDSVPLTVELENIVLGD